MDPIILSTQLETKSRNNDVNGDGERGQETDSQISRNGISKKDPKCCAIGDKSLSVFKLEGER